MNGARGSRRCETTNSFTSIDSAGEMYRIMPGVLPVLATPTYRLPALSRQHQARSVRAEQSPTVSALNDYSFQGRTPAIPQRETAKSTVYRGYEAEGTVFWGPVLR